MQYRLSPNVAWTQIENETVVLDLAAEWMYGLNETAGKIWRALSEGAGLSGLARLFSSDEGEAERIQPFLERFLADLRGMGLVEYEGSWNPPSNEVLPPEEPYPPWMGEGPAPPGVTWKQKPKQFAPRGCDKKPGENELCDTNPKNS